ncbi:MAG: bifunctional oligoribonuclease/PAP phosphatase NrnA [Anaerolineae bacterium]|nr:bifunctional oligoribonuclease/PAP phosphatase NrnA [Anaerolineae bacterium]
MKAPQWTEAARALDGAARILLVTHMQPDGDAIGSLLGFGNALRARGLDPLMAVDGGVPDFLEWLPGADSVKRGLSEGEWDVMVSLDSSDEERSGDCGVYGRVHSKLVVNVDHHPSNTMFGDMHIVVPDAVSTTEIVQDWIARMGLLLTLEIAEPLLVGLVTDTLGFRTSNVTARTLMLAQELMTTGASLSNAVARTLSSKPYQSIELWKRVLNSVRLDDDGLISGTIAREDWEAVGLDEATDNGLVGYLIATDEAKVAVVYKERADGQVELSLRSKPGYDVSTAAVSLGGGGHRQASGATIPGPLSTAPARVEPTLRAAIRNGA